MKYIITSILITISTALLAQDLDCKKYRNGKFQIIDEKLGTSTIERKGSRQIEYGEKSKLKIQFKVKWLDQCSYTLELKKILENPKNLKFPEDMILTVQIIETREDSYIQQTSSNLYELVLESEMIKIE